MCAAFPSSPCWQYVFGVSGLVQIVVLDPAGHCRLKNGRSVTLIAWLLLWLEEHRPLQCDFVASVCPYNLPGSKQSLARCRPSQVRLAFLFCTAELASLPDCCRAAKRSPTTLDAAKTKLWKPCASTLCCTSMCRTLSVETQTWSFWTQRRTGLPPQWQQVGSATWPGISRPGS